MSVGLMFERSLPPQCTPTTEFLFKVSTYFGTCIPTPLAFTSSLLGTLSILSWLWAQLPQLYKNYQIQSTAGLSIFFLAEWMLGDLTNLLGSFLTDQATWQIIIASYYTFVDICLVVQFFWYMHFKPWLVGGSLHSGDSSFLEDADSDMIGSLSPINTSFIEEGERDETIGGYRSDSQKSVQIEATQGFTASQTNYEKKVCVPQSVENTDKVRILGLGMPCSENVVRVATLTSLASQVAAAPAVTTFSLQSEQSVISITHLGTILSWSSTLLYLGSRLPQLYKNWKRQSTAGLSPLLFIAAFCGNLFYSTSLLTNPNAWSDFGPYGGHGWADETGSSRKDWVLRATPFFLGAAGVLIMDAAMGVQFMMYQREEEVIRVRDSHGFSRWEKVSGWMRGWIPEMQKARVVDLAESQRLLGESREIDRLARSYGGL